MDHLGVLSDLAFQYYQEHPLDLSVHVVRVSQWVLASQELLTSGQWRRSVQLHRVSLVDLWDQRRYRH